MKFTILAASAIASFCWFGSGCASLQGMDARASSEQSSFDDAEPDSFDDIELSELELDSTSPSTEPRGMIDADLSVKAKAPPAPPPPPKARRGTEVPKTRKKATLSANASETAQN